MAAAAAAAVLVMTIVLTIGGSGGGGVEDGGGGGGGGVGGGGGRGGGGGGVVSGCIRALAAYLDLHLGTNRVVAAGVVPTVHLLQLGPEIKLVVDGRLRHICNEQRRAFKGGWLGMVGVVGDGRWVGAGGSGGCVGGGGSGGVENLTHQPRSHN